jgi:hypothetical protein
MLARLMVLKEIEILKVASLTYLSIMKFLWEIGKK